MYQQVVTINHEFEQLKELSNDALRIAVQPLRKQIQEAIKPTVYQINTLEELLNTADNLTADNALKAVDDKEKNTKHSKYYNDNLIRRRMMF